MVDVKTTSISGDESIAKFIIHGEAIASITESYTLQEADIVGRRKSLLVDIVEVANSRDLRFGRKPVER